jgi:hypothetical protein
MGRLLSTAAGWNFTPGTDLSVCRSAQQPSRPYPD